MSVYVTVAGPISANSVVLLLGIACVLVSEFVHVTGFGAVLVAVKEMKNLWFVVLMASVVYVVRMTINLDAVAADFLYDVVLVS